MNHQDFINFLQKLKEQKISNGRLARYLGYNTISMSCFKNEKRPIPLVLIRACEGLARLDIIGIDLKNIVK
jgi:hypothetical protein